VAAADKIPPPRLPIAQRWSAPLATAPLGAPVIDGTHVYVSLRSGHVIALGVADGKEIWRKEKTATVPIAGDEGLVFVAAGEAIDALRGSDGAGAWTVPRVKAVAPLVAASGWVFAVTDAEVVAIRAKDGQVAWRHAAGGVQLAPAIDGDHVYVGANDGRVVALRLADGEQVWDQYLTGGVTAIAAHDGRVYAGAGDKFLYCLDGRRKGSTSWTWHTGALVTPHIAVDEERVYFAALNNVVWGLDRSNGNQRWHTPLRQRPLGGVFAAGHVIFVHAKDVQLPMLFDRNGGSTGLLQLAGEAIPDVPPAVREMQDGLHLVVATGGLSNEWQLTYFAPVFEATPVPFAQMPLPGLPYLTDPELQPIGKVLLTLILADPPLREFSTMTWPVILTDPPLEPLGVLPGLQLRPLSPVLPVRREY
jgi:outer membrane protein assembly factor BamB